VGAYQLARILIGVHVVGTPAEPWIVEEWLFQVARVLNHDLGFSKVPRRTPLPIFFLDRLLLSK
jgi:hypothetical protein